MKYPLLSRVYRFDYTKPPTLSSRIGATQNLSLKKASETPVFLKT